MEVSLKISEELYKRIQELKMDVERELLGYLLLRVEDLEEEKA